MKKIILNILKVVVTFGIFYFILKDHDLIKIKDQMLYANIPLFFLSSIIYSLVIVVFAFRWDLINKIYLINRPKFALFKHHLIGLFFSNLLPSSIGGDLWRIKYLSHYTKNKSTAFIIPLIERVSGMVSIVLISFSSFWYFADLLEVNFIFLYMFYLILSLIVILMLNSKTYKVINTILSKYSAISITNKLQSLVNSVSIIHEHKIVFLYATILSMFSQMIYALSILFLAFSLNIDLQFWQFVIVIPIIYFISIIPITINGYGLKEGAFIKLFVVFGVDELTQAIPLTFLILIAQIIVSLAGGLLFLFNKKESELTNEI